jgi:hypothetical protein
VAEFTQRLRAFADAAARIGSDLDRKSRPSP